MRVGFFASLIAMLAWGLAMPDWNWWLIGIWGAITVAWAGLHSSLNHWTVIALEVWGDALGRTIKSFPTNNKEWRDQKDVMVSELYRLGIRVIETRRKYVEARDSYERDPEQMALHGGGNYNRTETLKKYSRWTYSEAISAEKDFRNAWNLLTRECAALESFAARYGDRGEFLKKVELAIEPIPGAFARK